MSAKRKLTTSFEDLTENLVTKNGNEAEKINNNSKNKTEAVKEENMSLNKTETENLKVLLKHKKKPTIEETHTRKTFLIRNDLIERLEKITNRKSTPRGFQTQLINTILESALEQLEE